MLRVVRPSPFDHPLAADAAAPLPALRDDRPCHRLSNCSRQVEHLGAGSLAHVSWVESAPTTPDCSREALSLTTRERLAPRAVYAGRLADGAHRLSTYAIHAYDLGRHQTDCSCTVECIGWLPDDQRQLRPWLTDSSPRARPACFAFPFSLGQLLPNRRRTLVRHHH